MKLKKILWILSTAILFLTISSCGSTRTIAVEEGWEVLGDRKVNFIRDRDEIDVNSRNVYTAIRFRVEGKDISLNELSIVFTNGDKLQPAIDEVIPAGHLSRIIEIGRDGRFIDKIQFRYRTTGNVLSGRANVLVLGRRYTPGF